MLFLHFASRQAGAFCIHAQLFLVEMISHLGMWSFAEGHSVI